MGKGIFITGTDTGVGKTTATYVLGLLLRDKGFSVGVMKPVQCGGNDARFLKSRLGLKDSLALINPFFAPEPLSPHIAFHRAGRQVNPAKIIKAYRELEKNHDIVLIEGAGGLLVPLTDNYLVADLVRDLGVDTVIVARLGLGTINHTLMTLEQARMFGINVRGIMFNDLTGKKKGIPEKTNPAAIQRIGHGRILGTVPFLKSRRKQDVLRQCRSSFSVNKLLSGNVKNTRRWQELDKKYVWHPFTQMKDWLTDEPLIIREAKGSYLTDVDGRRYIDGVSSLWVNVHGHRHKTIDQAIQAQLNKVGHSTLLGLGNVPSVQLAQELIRIVPKGLSKVFYSDSGSTAVEIAIKIAFQYWKNRGQSRKKNIMHMEHSYHGDTLGSVSVGGIQLFHGIYRPLTFKAIKGDSPFQVTKTQGHKSQAVKKQEYLGRLERFFKLRHSTIAAFVVEPLVQAAAGMFTWPSGVLRGIAGLCKKYGIFLIADEVATGFGRTGKMFACEHEGVRPDFLCLAKGLTGGYLPLAATLTTQKVFEGFLFDYQELKTFFHGHTYTGNPLACAAALANLEIFRKERTLDRLQSKIKFLANELKRFYNLSHIGEIRQCGFMVGIELVQDRRSRLSYPLQQKIGIKVCEEVRKYGIILRPLGNVIVLMPPLSISRDELKILLKGTYQAIEKITGVS